MLKRVEISNFLTIEHILFDTNSNLIAIVGESGAGKSLVLKAIDTVFSQKISANITGNFSQDCSIKLFFELNEKQLLELSQFGIEDSEIVIEKIIKPKKTKAFINHEPISAKALSSMKDILLNIVSQNYRFRFFDENSIVSVLDKLIDKQTKDEFLKAYSNFIQIEKEKENIKEKIEFINEKHPEILLESIEKTDPKEKEYETLLDRLKTVKAASFAKEKSFEIINKLYENDNSVETILKQIEATLDKMSAAGFNTDRMKSTISDMYDKLTDIKDEFYNIGENVENENIDNIESRLFELEQLQRKFNKPLDDILKEKEELSQLIEEKDELELELKKTEEKLIETVKILEEKACNLSSKRKKASVELKEKIYTFLNKMLLENSVVEFVFNKKKIDRSGQDSVNIIFSANPDIKADKIDKIASGGERSRFILAMEAANSQIKDSYETLILDEIETGISDKTLQKTADVIKELSRNNQIILITHNKLLSEISNRVFRIEKEFDGNLTRSFARQIK